MCWHREASGRSVGRSCHIACWPCRYCPHTYGPKSYGPDNQWLCNYGLEYGDELNFQVTRASTCTHARTDVCMDVCMDAVSMVSPSSRSPILLWPNIVVACTVRAYIVLTRMVMAYTGMAYIAQTRAEGRTDGRTNVPYLICHN